MGRRAKAARIDASITSEFERNIDGRETNMADKSPVLSAIEKLQQFGSRIQRDSVVKADELAPLFGQVALALHDIDTRLKALEK